MCRANALVAVKRAGSGHLGSSFSALDIVVHLLWRELNVAELGWDHPDRDVFFSSKGHDVPGLYAALHALGVIPTERLLRLRRLGGLDGHPDLGIPGIEANSGSLGMGLFEGQRHGLGKALPRARGTSRRHDGRRRAAGRAELGGVRLGSSPARRQSLGDRRPERAPVRSADGGDPGARRPRGEAARVRLARRVVRRPRSRRRSQRRSPRCARRRTTCRRSSSRTRSRAAAFPSWSTRPRCAQGGGTYRWHAGAPDDEAFARAHGELLARIREKLPDLELEPVPPLEENVSLEGEPESGAGLRRVTDEYVAAAYGEELLTPGRRAARGRRAGCRPRLGLSDSRGRARGALALRRGRDRGAGHGVDGGGSRAGGTAPGRELLRELPRGARERADLQPGERGDEGRLRTPLRGPDPGRAREVAPEHPRRLAARGAAERDGGSARQLRRDARAAALGGRGAPARTSRSGLRSDLRRARSSFRRVAETPGRGTVLREGSDAVALRLRAGDAARGPQCRRGARDACRS